MSLQSWSFYSPLDQFTTSLMPNSADSFGCSVCKWNDYGPTKRDELCWSLSSLMCYSVTWTLEYGWDKLSFSPSQVHSDWATKHYACVQVVRQVFIWIVTLVVDLSTPLTTRSAQLDVRFSEKCSYFGLPVVPIYHTPGRYIGEDAKLCAKIVIISLGVRCPSLGSRDSSLGIATGYGLDDREVGVRIPVGLRFSLLHVETGSGAHPTSYPIGTGGSFPGGKAAGAWSWPPTSAEVKKMWVYTSTPPYAFMA
jgi:hypothetical protein